MSAIVPLDCPYFIHILPRLGLIESVGRKDTIVKPLLFATTDVFLKMFSIGNVSELPDYETLLEKLKEISYENTSVKTVEKPMFDKVSEDIPEFLQGEKVDVVE